tara:strand:+ start:117 stop:434 length:318 start_codon:yes stop_codon:yes gene_type:complete
MKKLLIDIDNTICETTTSDYSDSTPYKKLIKHFNDLYDKGVHITYYTARGGNSGKDWTYVTANQLEEWGVKYSKLMMHKPSYDLWIDDRCININDYTKKHNIVEN